MLRLNKRKANWEIFRYEAQQGEGAVPVKIISPHKIPTFRVTKTASPGHFL